MFTSRAEHRLLLREDNAAFRLSAIGRELGVLPLHAFQEVADTAVGTQELLEWLRSTRLPSSCPELCAQGITPPRAGTTLESVLRRPEVSLAALREAFPGMPRACEPAVDEQVEIAVKYEGYIRRQREAVARFERMEDARIPDGFNYGGIAGLSAEVREKLHTIQPRSLGQAARLSGITPAALSLLSIHLKRHVGR
jgi:tRNA uridine 5-carboxymethylaminomethyl modification enzyme